MIRQPSWREGNKGRDVVHLDWIWNLPKSTQRWMKSTSWESTICGIYSRVLYIHALTKIMCRSFCDTDDSDDLFSFNSSSPFWTVISAAFCVNIKWFVSSLEGGIFLDTAETMNPTDFVVPGGNNRDEDGKDTRWGRHIFLQGHLFERNLSWCASELLILM